MPLKAYAPGTRNGNKFYVFRGTIDGKQYERHTELGASTARKTVTAVCEATERGIRAEIEARRIPRPGESTTFRRAAEIYIAAKDSALPERKRIERLLTAQTTDGRHFADYCLADITHPVIVDLAHSMLPTAKPASRNRAVLVPVAAILHYASDEAKLCPHLKLKRFKEPPPRTRALDPDHAELLIAAAPEGPKRLLLLWLFRQGTRITDTLGVRWSDLDLKAQTVTMDIKKTKLVDHVKPLDPEVFEALAAIPEEERGHRRMGRQRGDTHLSLRDDWLFPWASRHGVYRWSPSLARQLAVEFTPHMARHTLATQMNATGASIQTIAKALDHRDHRSSARYTGVDIEVVRAAISKAYKHSKGNDMSATFELLCTLLSPIVGRPVSPVDLDGFIAMLAKRPA